MDTTPKFKTVNLSSNLTFFYKLAIPIMWMTFFGAFTLAVWFSGETNFGTFSAATLQTYMPIFFALGFLFFYWSMLRLKRVEIDSHFIYATNYIKTYRYPFHQIEKVVEKDFGLFRTIYIHLKQKGNFGKKIYFIASRSRYKKFLNEHPEIAKSVFKQY